MLYEEEPDGLCCFNGKVSLDPLPPLPKILENLFYGQNPTARHFRRYINSYNGAFTMTSAGITKYTPPGRGPNTYIIQGVPHHKIGTIGAPTGLTAKYIQLYLIDTEEATNNRADSSKYLQSPRAKQTLQ